MVFRNQDCLSGFVSARIRIEIHNRSLIDKHKGIQRLDVDIFWDTAHTPIGETRPETSRSLFGQTLTPIVTRSLKSIWARPMDCCIRSRFDDRDAATGSVCPNGARTERNLRESQSIEWQTAQVSGDAFGSVTRAVWRSKSNGRTTELTDFASDTSKT